MNSETCRLHAVFSKEGASYAVLVKLSNHTSKKFEQHFWSCTEWNGYIHGQSLEGGVMYLLATGVSSELCSYAYSTIHYPSEMFLESSILESPWLREN